MSRITLLNKDSVDFINRLASNGQGKTPLVSIAVAKALSTTLSLPSSPVDNPEQHYRTLCSLTVDTLLSRLNELVLVDVAALQAYTRKFYLARYFAAHPPTMISCFSQQTVLQDFFSLQMGVDPVLIETLPTDPLRLMQYHNSAQNLLKELAIEPDYQPEV